MQDRPHDDASPQVRGREVFEMHCAGCHGPSGEGTYIGPSAQPPDIAGRPAQVVKVQVRQGMGEMPAFSAAVLPDAVLGDLVTYVSETLAPPRASETLGPRAMSPFLIGVFVWGALILFCVVIAAMFGPGRN